MKKFIIGFFKYLPLIIIVLFTLVPIIWAISLGFRYSEEVLDIFPTKFTLNNIPKVISKAEEYGDINFFRMYGNSMLVSFFSIIGIIAISTLAAFGFSQYKFKGKEVIFIVFLLSFMIPHQVMLIPLFILMRDFKLLSTYFVLILPYIAFGLPLAILILRGFFEKIPNEIKEAAKIDGATDFKIFLKIILPLSKPAIATVITFSFLVVWNEFLFALTFIRDNNLQTIPIVLNKIAGAQFGVSWEMYGALIFLTIIPSIIIFIFFQRWFIAGLSAGAIKG